MLTLNALFTRFINVYDSSEMTGTTTTPIASRGKRITLGRVAITSSTKVIAIARMVVVLGSRSTATAISAAAAAAAHPTPLQVGDAEGERDQERPLVQPEQVPIVAGRVQDHEGQADGHEVAEPEPLDPSQQLPRVDPQLLEGDQLDHDRQSEHVP